MGLAKYSKSKEKRKWLVNNSEITNVVTDFDSTEYSSRALVNPMKQINSNKWVLVNRSRNGE